MSTHDNAPPPDGWFLSSRDLTYKLEQSDDEVPSNITLGTE